MYNMYRLSVIYFVIGCVLLDHLGHFQVTRTNVTIVRSSVSVGRIDAFLAFGCLQLCATLGWWHKLTFCTFCTSKSVYTWYHHFGCDFKLERNHDYLALPNDTATRLSIMTRSRQVETKKTLPDGSTAKISERTVRHGREGELLLEIQWASSSRRERNVPGKAPVVTASLALLPRFAKAAVLKAHFLNSTRFGSGCGSIHLGNQP